MNKKTVLVTGGAKGIGKSIVLEFAKSSYNVCINYNTSCESALKFKYELLDLGYNVDIFKADISNRNEVNELIDFCLKRFDSLDVVVNNAGICEYKMFCDITNEDVERMLKTNVIGTFNVTQSALKKYMIKNHKGSIINISSIWGMVGSSCEANYSMSKAAIIGMSKALAKEVGPSNIRVNVIAPGIIDTDMISNLSDGELKDIKDEIPLCRIGKGEDVAKLACFIASDNASYITGQVISPNGGWIV